MSDTEPSSTLRKDREVQLVRMLAIHERRVYGCILSMIPDWNIADDILQETFVKVWEQYDRFTPGTDFGAWACTIARYQVLAYRKSQARLPVIFSSDFLAAVEQEQQSQSSQMETQLAALEQCLQRLNGQSREMLRKFYEPQSRIDDVARLVGKSVNATYKLIRRLRHLLYECVERRLKGEQFGR